MEDGRERVSCCARNERFSAQGKKVANGRCGAKSEAARSEAVLRSDTPNRGRDVRDLEHPPGEGFGSGTLAQINGGNRSARFSNDRRRGRLGEKRPTRAGPTDVLLATTTGWPDGAAPRVVAASFGQVSFAALVCQLLLPAPQVQKGSRRVPQRPLAKSTSEHVRRCPASSVR